MKFIYGERGSGKTTKLIYTSEMTGYPIVTQSTRGVGNILKRAQELGVKIPKPMTVDEARTRGVKFEKILLDDGLLIINDILKSYFNGIEVATVTFASND